MLIVGSTEAATRLRCGFGQDQPRQTIPAKSGNADGADTLAALNKIQISEAKRVRGRATAPQRGKKVNCKLGSNSGGLYCNWI